MLVVHTADKEVFRLHCKSHMEFLEVWNNSLVFFLKIEDASRVINFLSFLYSDPTDCALNGDLLLVVTNDKVVDDHAGVVTMNVPCGWSTV